MSNLASLFTLLRQLGKVLCFMQCFCKYTLLRFESRHRVEQADNSRDESTPRHLQLRGSTCRICRSYLRVRKLPQTDRLIYRRLTAVLMHRVICNKNWCRLSSNLTTLVGLAVRLRIEHLVVIDHRRQQPSFRNITIDTC